MPDNSPQHELSDFLYSELLHSLGSYGVAVERLESLKARVEAQHDAQQWEALFPARVVARTCDYNRALRDLAHRPIELRDDYSVLQRSERTEPIDSTYPPRHPAPLVTLPGEALQFDWVVDYYATAVTALKSLPAGPTDSAERQLGTLLAVVHDPQRRETADNVPAMLDGRIQRHESRLTHAHECISLEPNGGRSAEILVEDMSESAPGCLHSQILAALVEAHLRMHRIEHLRSHSFGDRVRLRPSITDEVAIEARHSLVMNTFVYAAARSVPWIFAEDASEREYVRRNYKTCCTSLTPSYCMWIATQFTLLALHRRGYTWWLLGDMQRAYGDFHKLKRFIGSAETALEECSLEAPGTSTFLTALSALADHHTGRIYRAQHAHTIALRHFARAGTRLRRLESDPEARVALANSRWRIHLLVSQGKATYELGMVKRALLCYVSAWREFLALINTESEARANFEIADRIIGWLERTLDEPEIDKIGLARRFSPLVAQLEMSLGPIHLRLLAAEIMMRIGHVLLILRLPSVGTGGSSDDYILDDHLATRCLRRAHELDSPNTLVVADLLKIDYRRRYLTPEQRARSLTNEHLLDLHETDICKQWPSGGGEFEEAARVVEYALQRWLNQSDEKVASTDGHVTRAKRRREIARELLAVFLYHTDNTNVKLAQVYRYLMQTTSDRHGIARRSSSSDAPTIDLVCARRYSSFFPFLPRPSAFRVPGGGYFLQVHEKDQPRGSTTSTEPATETTFGIAVDPGPNFLHNLYSCGYSLDDVHMVIVTHDHADHLAALDALFALLGYRARLGAKNFTRKRKLTIVGNESVVKRYEFYKKSRRDSVEVLSFERLRKITCEGAKPGGIYPLPKTLRVEPVAGVEHYDSAEAMAQAFLLSVGHGSSRSTILFTADTGIPRDIGGPEPELVAPGKPFSRALAEATIIVAHVSSVRLPELREIGGLVTPDGEAAKITQSFDRLWQDMYAQKLDKGAVGDTRAEQRLAFLLRELQFGFHSLPKGRDEALGISPLDDPERFRKRPDRHLYLSGLLAIGERLASRKKGGLLLIGELREELGTFRTGIAATLNEMLFKHRPEVTALTMDIGLRLRVTAGAVEVLCTTCDLDNDLVDSERFHAPRDIREVCVKGEDEGVFYNCTSHDRRAPRNPAWIERVERYDPFGRYDPFRP